MRTSGHHRAPKPTAEQVEAVLDAFRDGNRDAFHLVYFAYEAPVMRFCKHMLGSNEAAQDAFQEAFIRVYEHRSTLLSDNVKSWIYTIVRRVCLNHIRARRIEHVPFDEVFHSNPDSPDADVFMQTRIRNAISALPVQLREALILRDVEGHSYHEIASIVGIDLSLAKVRVFRARLILRKVLAPIVKADK